MRVITHEFSADRSTEMKLVFIGDIHLGHVACDEDRLRRTVEYVRDTSNCYWIGMGDYGDFVSRTDPRFSAGSLAKWIKIKDVSDLPGRQLDRVVSFLRPIAGKCLGLAEGNHETAIHKHYDRNIYYELRRAIEVDGKHGKSLGIDYSGWINLVFRRAAEGSRKGGTSTIKIKVHHGFGGGKAQANFKSLSDLVSACNADIVAMGHTHKACFLPFGYEEMSQGRVEHKTRFGVQTGTYLSTTVPGEGPIYSEVGGYLPLGMADVRVTLRPCVETKLGRIEATLLSI